MSKNASKIIKRVLFVILFVVLLPLVILEGIITIIKKIVQKRKWQKQELDGHKVLLSLNITDIDLMEGYMFEDYLKILLFYLGYKVATTKKSRDYGADLIIKNKEGQTIAVQAKRYNKTVGSKAVQEIVAAKRHYTADEIWVISNNLFSGEAETLAKENGVRLIDRNELIEMYTEARKILSIDSKENNLAYDKTDLKQKYPYYI